MINDHVQLSTKFQMLILDADATCAISLWYLRTTLLELLLRLQFKLISNWKLYLFWSLLFKQRKHKTSVT